MYLVISVELLNNLYMHDVTKQSSSSEQLTHQHIYGPHTICLQCVDNNGNIR